MKVITRLNTGRDDIHQYRDLAGVVLITGLDVVVIIDGANNVETTPC